MNLPSDLSTLYEYFLRVVENIHKLPKLLSVQSIRLCSSYLAYNTLYSQFYLHSDCKTLAILTLHHYLHTEIGLVKCFISNE